jgi:hypothetical protein
MSGAVQEVLLDDELIEKDFNDALDDLQKSLESDSKKNLQKAKKDKGGDDPEPDPDPDEDKGEEDDDDDDDMDYEKSISEILADDPDTAAAIDVEPFLRQLAKAMDETIMSLKKSMQTKLNKMEALVKSQGEVLLMTAKLEKSTSDIIHKIGGQTVRSNSVTVLNKSRFGEDPAAEYDNATVLQKSREWVRSGKIDLTESGMIEGRVNKRCLGKVNDRLDQKVAALMKEGN